MSNAARPQIENAARGRTRSDFRIPNESERLLLGLIHRASSLTQAEATRMMAPLTQPTVSRLVGGLRDAGLVHLGKPTIVGRGQPSVILQLQHDYAYGLGISLLGDALSVSLVDFAGTVCWALTQPMPSMGRANVLAMLDTLRTRMLDETGIDASRIFAAGVGVSAFFVGDGALMNPPPLLDDWALVDIPSILEDALQLPVSVDNDGNAACIGEAMLGAGRQYRSFAYFQITNGFGGGLVLEGRPYRGSFGNAGEFAALWTAAGMLHPNLERLRAILNDEGHHFPTVAAMLDGFDCEWFGVERWLDEGAPAFSLAATAASAVIDCEAIVLGGRIPRSLALLLARRITIAGTDRRGRPRPLPVILPAVAEGDVVATGAALSVLQPTFFAGNV